MSDLLGALLQFFLTFATAVGELVYWVWSLGRSSPEDSRLGDSQLDRYARQSWNRACLGCLVLLLILPVGGLIWWLK